MGQISMANSTKLKVAFLFTLIAVGVHLYLTDHYFNLTFGLQGGESICNISTKINCDTVTASPYSSIFNTPIALWGAMTNSILALLLLIWIAGWSSDNVRLGRYTALLSGFTALTSVVMGSISTILIGSYCLFCMGEYLISFIIFGLVVASLETSTEQPKKSWGAHLAELAGPAKMYLAFLAAIPAGAIFFNQVILTHFDAQELPAIVRAAVADWQASPEIQFNEPPAYIQGGSQPKMVIVEFADFRCPHCRHAVSPIKAFVDSHADAQLRFFAFPLDGACNDAIPSSDGISCYLAKAVYCSEKVAAKGDLLHEIIFEHQDSFIANASLPYAKEHVLEYMTANQIKPADITACIENPDTDKAIRAQAKLGVNSGVKGTPTFFVNGRKLSKGQLIPVLEAVHATLSK